jgi:hypothetical protein
VGLLSVPAGERSWWEVVRWWELRRWPYNLIVAAAGIVGVVLILLMDMLPPRLPRPRRTSSSGRLVRHSAPYRYVWPSELDLMAQLAGLRQRERWAGWTRAPFTSDSTEQVAVFEKVA